ncbi:Thrombospondin type-1 domain-containing protein 4 [Galemys pyrenaicus]|uniref:Thrombospondin type-1 domain-containing protein 4 n=1 Tax=Galemys pyrenaicus TaxID=202257 RepID=A0A8J6A6N7_GALPY|nr:Thrombospondin type-1 domain-containing protein 4 [Galemys pyrenaicus]
MTAVESAPEDSGGGTPGVWGSWGPWSACSRSCSGGVMEQTRPCLPGSYRARGGRRPGIPARTFAGHVVSAVRTSVPLHRSRDEARAPAGFNASRQGPLLRGSRHPPARGREPTVERSDPVEQAEFSEPGTLSQLEDAESLPSGLPGILWFLVNALVVFSCGSLPSPCALCCRYLKKRQFLQTAWKVIEELDLKPGVRNPAVFLSPVSRTRGPIGPGKYGYGKAPYILPLQTDSAHSPQRLRRQRPSALHSRSQGASGLSHDYSAPAHQAPRYGPLYRSDSGPGSALQVSEASIYQLPLTHDQGFPAGSSLFHGPETGSSHGLGTPRAAQSFSQPARTTAISCIGTYRQYKLCNTDVSTVLLVLGLGSRHACLSAVGKINDASVPLLMEADALKEIISEGITGYKAPVFACPESSRSIREVQCASYNNKPFMGRFYEWEPFAEAFFQKLAESTDEHEQYLYWEPEEHLLETKTFVQKEFSEMYGDYWESRRFSPIIIDTPSLEFTFSAIYLGELPHDWVLEVPREDILLVFQEGGTEAQWPVFTGGNLSRSQGGVTVSCPAGHLWPPLPTRLFSGQFILTSFWGFVYSHQAQYPTSLSAGHNRKLGFQHQSGTYDLGLGNAFPGQLWSWGVREFCSQDFTSSECYKDTKDRGQGGSQDSPKGTERGCSTQHLLCTFPCGFRADECIHVCVPSSQWERKTRELLRLCP